MGLLDDFYEIDNARLGFTMRDQPHILIYGG